MKIFIDTANIDEIKSAAELGVVCGVTTNPSLIAKEGKKFEDVIAEITEIVDGPISAEVTGTLAPDMVEQAKELANAKAMIWPLFYTGAFYLIFVGLLTLLFGYFEKKLSYYKV